MALKRQQANILTKGGSAVSSSYAFEVQDSCTNGVQSLEFGMPIVEGSFSGLQPNYNFMAEPEFGEELNYTFDQRFATETNNVLDHSSLLDSYGNGVDFNRTRLVTIDEEIDVLPKMKRQIHLEARQSSIPTGLPFLINGIDTAIQRQLFCHFTGVMSSLLAITVKGSNPFNAMIIPLGLQDRIVMNTILCLAGSHITKLKQGAHDSNLLREQTRIHEAALQAQALRFHNLRSLPHQSVASISIDEQDAIVAASMLLCLYEICEGTGDDKWRLHLNRARETITTFSQSQDGKVRPVDKDSLMGPEIQEPIITEINPFLVEFYLYHDSLSKVTAPSQPVSRRIRSASQVEDSYMVGVQDGLSNFITRISALRLQADTGRNQPNGDMICKAVLIWQDLEMWKPLAVASTERRLIMEFYQWALFIWLFSIVYPEDKANEKIQGAVRRIADSLCNIKSSEGVMSCLLFPLFIVGSAAIQTSDREAISTQFARLRAWSSLGNIDLTYGIVQQMWDDHDHHLPNSWDWVKQLEMRGMSFLVT